MKTARHLALILLLAFGTSVHAQEADEAEVPAPRRSLLKTAATREFNKALYFDQLDNGVVLPPMELEYDLESSQGTALKIGNVVLSEKSFYFALMPLGKTHSQINQILSPDESQKVALIMALPDNLVRRGTIEMISRTGAVLWTYKFDEKDLSDWAKKTDTWRKDLITRGVPAKNLRAGLFNSKWGLVDARSAGAPFWRIKDSFRFCVSQTEGRSSSRICSQRYGIQVSDTGIVMGKVRVDATTPRVLVKNEDAPLKQSIKVATDMPIAFFSELKTGESYEFVALPNKLELMDISDTKNPHTLRIVGYDTRPLGRSVILNPDQYSSLTKMIGFEATIGDPRKFWAAAISRQEPKIYLPGQGGGIFKQKFELSEIPRAQSRVFLHQRTPKGTYSDGIKLSGRKQPSAKVSSEQNSVEAEGSDNKEFTWRFKATERGEINRSYLNVEFEGKTYRSYFELYKGFPREISGRLSGIQAGDRFIVIGELAYNQWFEDIFSWSNYWVSRQRWGVAAKYFKSLNELRVSNSGATAPLTVMTLDLKYRMTPGLWNRDETVGALVSYQDVTFDKLKAPMVGAGAFWARSMPKVLDDMFNIFPFMRYPKWVDMELIVYGMSLNSDVALDTPLSLNFHGKVLWTDRYFGEAGFGIKRYSFQDKSLNQQASLNTLYGTVGLGISF